MVVIKKSLSRICIKKFSTGHLDCTIRLEGIS